MRYFISLLFLLVAFSSQAQVGIGIATPDSNAILHLESNDKGFLPTRLTRTERDNIINPPTGLVIYNTTDSSLQFFDGTCWRFTFQESCDDCYFTYSISSILDTLDRTQSDSVVVTLNVNQYAGNPSQIALFINGNLPPGLTYYFTNNPINSSSLPSLTKSILPSAGETTQFPISLSGSLKKKIVKAIRAESRGIKNFTKIPRGSKRIRIKMTFNASFLTKFSPPRP